MSRKVRCHRVAVDIFAYADPGSSFLNAAMVDSNLSFVRSNVLNAKSEIWAKKIKTVANAVSSQL